MKTLFKNGLQWLQTFSCANNQEVTDLPENKRSFSSLKPAFKQTLSGIMLLLGVSGSALAQTFPCNTFVKQVDGVGNVEPRIFKDPTASNYYMTARSNDSTFISNVNASGTVVTTQILKFAGDQGTITDMIVDKLDFTIAGVVKGNNKNYMFKYNYATATFNWIMAYPVNYIFQNIHQMSTAPNDYIVTGEISGGAITIFQVKRTTGSIGIYQNSGFTGEFFSTYDGTDVYGACRYYTNPANLFNPSLFRFNANSGNNLWANTYVRNITPTARIYPVAPIVDGNSIMQLSSGDDVNFNTYTSGPTKIWLLQTDLAGNLAWTNQISIPGCTQPNVKKIINTATGYYLLIDSYNGSIINCFYVVKTDKSGNILWANRYGISGQNTVISGIEDNGFLFLTATSGSYTSPNGLLLLKIDQNGLSDPNCNYIKVVSASSAAYNNTQVSVPTVTNNAPFGNGPTNVSLNKTRPIENIYCSTSCNPSSLPCNTLTGSLAAGVLAFYPFGYGSLNDVSGNGYNLVIGGGSPTPTADRSSNPTCAYHFERSNGDFLTRAASGSTFLDNITTSPFSISLWYRPTNPVVGTRGVGDYELLVGRGSSGLHCPDTWSEWSAGLYDCRKAVVGFDQYSHWQASSSAGCSAQMAAITGVWHHLAFVYNGSSYSLFVDGALTSTSSGPCGAMSANVGALMLGTAYTGDLDDIIIYNRALSTSEVFSLMALNGSCCNGTTSSNRTIQNTGVNTQTVAGGIKVYPNPTSGQISVSAGNTVIRSIAVYNNTGALMGTYHFSATEVSINMNQFASGVYFLKVVTDSGSSIEKVIKE